MDFTRFTHPVHYPDEFKDNDKRLIRDVANLSSLAYQEGLALTDRWQRYHDGRIPDPVPADDVLNRLTKPDIIDDRRVGLQAFASEYKPNMNSVLVVVVRGTTDLTDFFKDIDLAMVDFTSGHKGAPLSQGIRVHRGFRQQSKALVERFGENINDYLEHGGHVLFAGHSLGGAVSTLLALEYGARFPQKIWNVTFGSPAVGNEQCDQSLDLIWRLKNGRDPVCKAFALDIAYKQVGFEIHLGNPDPVPLPILLDLPDHKVSSYIRNLG